MLEGGGMRCVFTAGVLDYFMDHDIYFPYVVGVSGGACNAVCYVARQRGREKACLIDLYEKYHYISLKNWITKRSMFDFHLVFDEFSYGDFPFDFNTYFHSPIVCETVTSNCLTGQAEYLDERKDEQRLTAICKASCSLPVIMQQQQVDGVPMLDGGICDPVPIRRAMETGHRRNVVVLTRTPGHRSPYTHLPIPSFMFSDAIRPRMADRGKRYNETLAFVEEERRQGNALVIQPQNKLKVTAVGGEIPDLRELYEEGYEAAKAIHAFLEKESETMPHHKAATV